MSMPLLYFVTKKYFSDKIAFTSLILLTFNFYHLRYSVEAKPYIFLVLFSIISIYYFLRLTENTPASHGRKMLFIVNLLLWGTHIITLPFILIQYIILGIRRVLLAHSDKKKTVVSLIKAPCKYFGLEIAIFLILFSLRIFMLIRFLSVIMTKVTIVFYILHYFFCS
jgi:uncharacterized membrane protein